MSFNSSNSGRRQISDINVTPMVDVMLVLLIIFMVTTPMIQQGEKIDLPKTDSALLNDESNNKHITLSIDKLKMISLDGKKVSYDRLDESLLQHKSLQIKKEVFLEADKNIPYGFVLKVIAKIRNAGIPKVNLITESED